MSNRLILALCILIAAGVVGTMASESPEREPKNALIVIEGVHSRDGIGEMTAISVLDRPTIEKLEAFFPNYRTRPSSDRAGGWEAGYRVYFNFDQGRSIRVTVSLNGGGDTWSMGQGDFSTRGDFEKFMDELQRRVQR